MTHNVGEIRPRVKSMVHCVERKTTPGLKLHVSKTQITKTKQAQQQIGRGVGKENCSGTLASLTH